MKNFTSSAFLIEPKNSFCIFRFLSSNPDGTVVRGKQGKGGIHIAKSKTGKNNPNINLSGHSFKIKHKSRL